MAKTKLKTFRNFWQLTAVILGLITAITMGVDIFILKNLGHPLLIIGKYIIFFGGIGTFFVDFFYIWKID